MAKKHLRRNKHGFYNPRKLLEHGDWLQLTLDEMVFVALSWCGFSNTEAYGVIRPRTSATPNSFAVMAGRYANNYKIKRYIRLLNEYQSEQKLGFKNFKGYYKDYYKLDND